ANCNSQEMIEEEDDDEDGAAISEISHAPLDISQLIANAESQIDSLDHKEEEDISLDQADAADLDTLDSQLQKIFSERTQSKRMKFRKASTVLKLKIKVSCWVSQLLENIPDTVSFGCDLRCKVLLNCLTFLQSLNETAFK